MQKAPPRRREKLQRFPSTLLKKGFAPPTGDLCVVSVYTVVVNGSSSNTLGGTGFPRIVTLHGSARGSNFEKMSQQGQIMPSIPKSAHCLFKCKITVMQNLAQTFLKPSQILAKPSQILSQIKAKSVQKASWSPSRANA